MRIIIWLLLAIFFLLFVGGLAVLVILIIDRVNKRDKETFERRNN